MSAPNLAGSAPEFTCNSTLCTFPRRAARASILSSISIVSTLCILSKIFTAVPALFDCKCPISSHDISKSAAAIFSAASWTRFSPTAANPYLHANSTACKGWNLVTGSIFTSDAFLPQDSAAFATRSCRRAQLSANFSYGIILRTCRICSRRLGACRISKAHPSDLRPRTELCRRRR